jgi:hypothetical protein
MVSKATKKRITYGHFKTFWYIIGTVKNEDKQERISFTGDVRGL